MTNTQDDKPQGPGYMDEAVECVAQAICDDEWEGSQPPFDQKPRSFGERYRKRARAALDALATLPPAPSVSEDHQWSHDVLHDLVMLRAEEWALNGGGPGIKERWEKAWRAAEEIFEP